LLTKEERHADEWNQNQAKEGICVGMNKIVCLLFILAACCFLAGAVNHAVHMQEGVWSSLLLAAGCVCGAIAFYKRK
jgi:hypothetical protein